MKNTQSRLLAIWGWPVALGLLTGIGLIAALFSDGGLGDTLSGICLGIPTVCGIWYGLLRRAPR
ncbi:hypothetical protein ACJJWD_10770 [Comamonas testosteroni]|uniref:hypothetical protein n=1 Tax=Comamonas testosteroni TaxID=285 RepID=UPI003899B877